MAVSRRSFLVGAGSIITAGFIRDARAFLGDTGNPLLLPPQQRVQDLYYEQVEDHWHLHLGQPQFELPDPPLWIDHLRARGYLLDTDEQIAAFCESECFDEHCLNEPLDGYGWEEQWEYAEGPEAKAFLFLKQRGLLPSRSGFERAGKIVFQSFPNPMSSARWVEVQDPLSLSLLQARLNELDMGVAVRALRAAESGRREYV